MHNITKLNSLTKVHVLCTKSIIYYNGGVWLRINLLYKVNNPCHEFISLIFLQSWKAHFCSTTVDNITIHSMKYPVNISTRMLSRHQPLNKKDEVHAWMSRNFSVWETTFLTLFWMQEFLSNSNDSGGFPYHLSLRKISGQTHGSYNYQFMNYYLMNNLLYCLCQ